MKGQRETTQHTLRNQGENGRTWSRPSAQAWREAAASALRQAQMLKRSGIIIMQTVPVLLPVEARNT